MNLVYSVKHPECNHCRGRSEDEQAIGWIRIKVNLTNLPVPDDEAPLGVTKYFCSPRCFNKWAGRSFSNLHAQWWQRVAELHPGVERSEKEE